MSYFYGLSKIKILETKDNAHCDIRGCNSSASIRLFPDTYLCKDCVSAIRPSGFRKDYDYLIQSKKKIVENIKIELEFIALHFQNNWVKVGSVRELKLKQKKEKLETLLLQANRNKK